MTYVSGATTHVTDDGYVDYDLNDDHIAHGESEYL
jgi:hypothetical protein